MPRSRSSRRKPSKKERELRRDRKRANLEELRQAISKRVGISLNDIQCPWAKSDMTPCIVSDGDCALLDDNETCVGCGKTVREIACHEQEQSNAETD